MHLSSWIWIGIALVAVVLLLALLPQFTPSARLRRRLRKTHGRIVSKARGPAVKFSVKSPKE